MDEGERDVKVIATIKEELTEIFSVIRILANVSRPEIIHHAY